MRKSPYPPCPKCGATQTRRIEYGVRRWSWLDKLLNPFIEASVVDYILTDFKQYLCPKCSEKWGTLDIHRFSGRTVLIFWSPSQSWDGVALDLRVSSLSSELILSGVKVNRRGKDPLINVVEETVAQSPDIVVLTTHAVGRLAFTIAELLRNDSRTSDTPVFLWASPEDHQIMTPEEKTLFTKIVIDSDTAVNDIHDLVVEQLESN